MKTSPTLPRGIRNHNPGNLRWGDPWQGLIPKAQRNDPDFCQFQSAAYGIRALARTLITYQDKHGLRTIRQIITRWAPPVENETGPYIHSVAQQSGLDSNQKLDLHHYPQIKAVVSAIIRHENGKGPIATPNTWYEAAHPQQGPGAGRGGASYAQCGHQSGNDSRHPRNHRGHRHRRGGGCANRGCLHQPAR